MIYILLNFWEILAATAAGGVVGLVIYRLAGLSFPSISTAVIALLSEFWIASILAGALILAPEIEGEWTMAIGSAVVIWLGFVLPVMLTSQRWRGDGLRRTVVDNIHWLAVMVVQVIVLQALGLVPPPGAELL